MPIRSNNNLRFSWDTCKIDNNNRNTNSKKQVNSVYLEKEIVGK